MTPQAPEQLASPFDDKFGLVVTEWTAERTTGHAPVEGNTQIIGLWHGGASATMMESLGSLAATAHAGPERYAVGTELNVSHLRSAREGQVHGVATAVHLGRTSAVYQIDLRNDDEQLVATGRLTCRIMS